MTIQEVLDALFTSRPFEARANEEVGDYILDKHNRDNKYSKYTYIPFILQTQKSKMNNDHEFCTNAINSQQNRRDGGV